MEKLIALDKDLFIVLNDLHTPWLDPLMIAITNTLSSLPLFIFIAYLIIKDLRKHAWIFLLGIALTITLADQTTSALMKPYFERLRPSHDPTLGVPVHTVNHYKGGLYGFASSHAANTFGTATFLYLTMRSSHRWIKWMFLWAFIVTYSRIYLGVHFPGDILIGGVVGALYGWLSYKLCVRVKDHLADRQTSRPADRQSGGPATGDR